VLLDVIHRLEFQIKAIGEYASKPTFSRKQTSAEAFFKRRFNKNTGFESFYSWQIIVLLFKNA
jgi:hypothetical protein